MFITQHIHQEANVKAWNGFFSILYLNVVVVFVLLLWWWFPSLAVSVQLPDSRMLWRSARNSRKWVKLDLLI